MGIYSGALAKETIPLPGGETAVYNGSGLNFIRHADWLGSSRLATTWAQAVYSKEAYAPFGETYNEAGAPDRSFTGQDQDVVTGTGGTGVYDFLFRKYDPSAGRWLSPDPAGWAVVDQTTPQSLNRYAYVQNNPMSATDPNGLACVYIDGSGNVSVSDFGADAQWASGCAANGGNYVDGYVDQSSVQPIPGQSSYNYNNDGSSSFTYGGNNVVFGGQTYQGMIGDSSDLTNYSDLSVAGMLSPSANGASVFAKYATSPVKPASPPPTLIPSEGPPVVPPPNFENLTPLEKLAITAAQMMRLFGQTLTDFIIMVNPCSLPEDILNEHGGRPAFCGPPTA
jgi:RHS repeat-associated protein